MAVTNVSDIIVPEIFTPYVQQLTEEKARIVQSGALARDADLDNHLAGGGLTFNAPSFRDLDNSEENVSSDTGDPSTPKNIQTSNEIAVRLSRNNSWGSADLAGALAGADPMEAIANRVGYYWSRRLQAAFVATMRGVFANNAAEPTGGSTHTQNDMTFDISGGPEGTYEAGATDFSAPAFIDAAVTMGDSMEALGLVVVHSIVYARMQKNNLIEFIPDARGETTIPTFLGRTVVIDDGMPNSGGVFETWMFGAGSVRLGMGTPKVPTEVKRNPDANNGGGEEVLYSRVEWAIHPVGYAYVGAAPNGGPSNAATANNLAAADSWRRVYPERKQIQIARLITREY